MLRESRIDYNKGFDIIEDQGHRQTNCSGGYKRGSESCALHPRTHAAEIPLSRDEKGGSVTLIDFQPIGHTPVRGICEVEEHAACTHRAVGFHGIRRCWFPRRRPKPPVSAMRSPFPSFPFAAAAPGAALPSGLMRRHRRIGYAAAWKRAFREAPVSRRMHPL